MCRDLRFDLGLGASLLHKAAAEIGLRAFRMAQRDITAFERTSIRGEDPFYRLESLILTARLRASQGDVSGAIETESELEADAPRRALGTFLAVLSILCAGAGDTERARWLARRARRNGSDIEMIHCSNLGELIADEVEGHEERFRVKAVEAVVASKQAAYLDGLVLAYRVHPKLLQAATDNARSGRIVRELLAKSRDYDLARGAAIAVRTNDSDEVLGALTRREREVLTLVAEGLTNAEIADRLFIATSTAKVHVRHILEKLGVRSRFHAAMRAQELMESRF
jgi:ATP/maltotriose-dependent transcriptional regulator MalT